MTDGVRLLYQLRGLAKVGVRPGGIDHCVDFAHTENRPRVHSPTGFAGDGQRFSGQRGLIDFYGIALQQARVRRHDVAQSQPYYVAGHQFRCLRVDPLSITFHFRLDRKSGPEGGDGIARLVFFPESDHGVGNKQKEDDSKIEPVSDRCRKDHGRFDHPRDGTPKIAEEFQELIGLLLRNFVRTILSQPLLRLGLTEAVWRRPQFFLHLRHGQGFQIVLRIGFRSRLRSRRRSRCLGLFRYELS